MSGHSHWATIKHKKASVDAKRGKIWSKLAKAVIVAAKMGGGDPDMNFRLRTAIDAAKAAGMPKENIARAVKRGTGEGEGINIEEVAYEGYGPGGVAVLVECMTDNRNRTASEIRKIFDLSDGKLGGAGSVAWMFESKAFFLVPSEKTNEDQLLELALEAGAEDVKAAGGKFEVTSEPTAFRKVSEALVKAGIPPEVSQIMRIAKNTVDLDAATAEKVLKLMDRLDDHDDVQNVSVNFSISDEVMAEIGKT
jgi:YebC/PmpR family DNA-binding regulatory protein